MTSLDDGFQAFRIRIQLLLAVCRVHNCDEGQHHLLVPDGQVVQKLLAVCQLLLHVVRNDGAEVVIGVLLSLPGGDVGGHAQQPVLRLPDGLRHGHRQNIDGKHHVLVQAGQLRHQGILQVRRHILDEQASPEPLPHPEMVTGKLHAVRADIVLETVTLSPAVLQIEVKVILLAHPVEAVQNLQPFPPVQFLTPAAQLTKA